MYAGLIETCEGWINVFVTRFCFKGDETLTVPPAHRFIEELFFEGNLLSA